MLHKQVTLAVTSKRIGTIVKDNPHLGYDTMGRVLVIWDEVDCNDPLCGSKSRYDAFPYRLNELKIIRD